MELHRGQITSPVHEWSQDLLRRLERTSLAESRDPDDIDTAERQPETEEEPLLDPEAGVPPVGISRALPARTTPAQFASIASAFDIYSEPDMAAFGPSPPIPTSHLDYESPQRSDSVTLRRMEPINETTAMQYHHEDDDSELDEPPLPSAQLRASVVGSITDHPTPPAMLARYIAGRTPSTKIHTVNSMASISSSGTSDPGPSSAPSGAFYGDSIRSTQSSPPLTTFSTPPTSPKRPTLNTNYVRPLSMDAYQSQTPLVEVGPALSVRSLPKPSRQSQPPPFQHPNTGLAKSKSTSTPSPTTPNSARRRTLSYYAMAEARSDQILNPQASQTPSSQSISQNMRSFSMQSAPPPQRETRLSVPSVPSAPSPQYRDMRSDSTYTVTTEDSEGSAFAPRTHLAIESDFQPAPQNFVQTSSESYSYTTRPSQPPESQSYSDFYVLPEDHTSRADRPAPPSNLSSSPPRRQASAIPGQSVTDTFKEAVLEIAPTPPDVPRDMSNYVTRPPLTSPTQRSYRSSASDIPRLDSVAEYEAMRSRQSMPPIQNAPAPQSQYAYYRTIEQPSNDVQVPHPQHPSSYDEVPREVSAYPQAAPSPPAEPQSQLELIRKKNRERKRGKPRALRIVNA